MKLSKEVG